MGELTPRQKKFCELYAIDPCGERAAIAAGYQEKSARQQSSRLLTKGNIQEYIHEIQEETKSERIMCAESVKAFWTSVIKDESQRMTDRLQASALLARSGGFFQANVKMELSGNSEKRSKLICLPAIPGIDPPRRDDRFWIYSEEEADLVHGLCSGGDL